MWVLAQIFEHGQPIVWSLHLLGLMTYIGSIATALGYWGVIELCKRLPAITSSLSLLGVPIVGLLSSAWILGDAIHWDTATAIVLLITGLACVTVAK